MDKEVLIYHVETQEDYDDLMVELEQQGYVWCSDDKPTKYTPLTKPPMFIFCRDNQRKKITVGTKGNVEECYLKKVVRYKAKGVNQMEKVVVPQFVADYIEGHYQGLKPGDWDKADLIRAWDDYIEGYGSSELRKWIKNDGNFLKLVMAIATNEYEVEEKKYYWRKKKEHLLEFEDKEKTYLTISYNGRVLFSDNCLSPDYHTKLTETEARQVVSEEDFNKLEKVEITE